MENPQSLRAGKSKLFWMLLGILLGMIALEFLHHTMTVIELASQPPQLEDELKKAATHDGSMSEPIRAIREAASSLKIRRWEANSPSVGDCQISFVPSQRVSPEVLQKALKIIPDLPVKLIDRGDQIVLQGNFLPGSTYQIQVQKGLKAENGLELVESIQQTITFPNRQPMLRFGEPGQILNLYGKTQIPLETINFAKVDVLIYKIYPNNVLHFLKQENWPYNIAEYAQKVADQSLILEQRPNEMVETIIDFKAMVKDSIQGAYFLRIKGPRTQIEDDEEYYYDHSRIITRLVFISDLGITVKDSTEGNVLVWVTSLGQAKPIEGAKVIFWSSKNQILASVMSDAYGVVHYNLPKSLDGHLFLVQAQYGEDTNILQMTNGSWNQDRFAVEGVKTQTQGYRGFIFSSRNIYLPGELAQCSALVRTPQRQIPSPFPMLWTVKRSDGLEVYRQSAMGNESGMVDFSWAIASDLRTGPYQVALEIPGALEKIASYTLLVEEFVPDRLRIKIEGPIQPIELGQSMPIACIAEQLQGPPAAGHAIKLEAQLLESAPFHLAYPNYTWGDDKKRFTPQTLLQQEKISNEQGKAEFVVTLPQGTNLPSMLNLQIQATVHEIGGRSTTQRLVVPVYPYPTYLGIRRQSNGRIEPGKPISFDLLAIDAQSNLKPSHVALVQVHKIEWLWNRRVHQDRVVYDYIEQATLLQEQEITLNDGTAAYSYMPPEHGSYSITLFNPHRMSTVLHFNTWGYGQESVNPSNREYLELTTDHPQYKSGDTVTVNIKSPFDGCALVTLERDKIFESRIIQVQEGKAQLTFTFQDQHLPNVYCTATVIRSQLKPNPEHLYRAYGIVPVLGDAQRKLEVAIEVPKEVRPQTSTDVQVKLCYGNAPLQNGYVTIAAVDEGICQLTNFATPDPYQFFYAKESLQVNSNDLYRMLLAESPPGGKSTPIRSATPAPVRAKKSVCFWFPNLKTDAQGQVQVTLPIPQYIGQLRIMAIAHQGEYMGAAQQNLIVNAPLVVRLMCPRFAAWNDQFTITALILNQTKSAGLAQISLAEHEGLKLLSEVPNQIYIEAGKQAAISIPVESLPPCAIGKIKIQALLNEEKTQETLAIPMRSPYPPSHISGNGVLTLGKEHCLSMSGDWQPGTGEQILTIAKSPLLQFSARLESLVQYPYGCVEQTTSRGFPLIYLQEILDFQAKKTDKQAPEYVQEAIARLATMQTPKGGFGMWPGDDEDAPWATCYATHFLWESSQAGYDVPAQTLNAALNWLMRKHANFSTQRSELEVRAYAAFILARARKIGLSEISWVWGMKQYFSPTACIWASSAFYAIGQKEQAQGILSWLKSMQKDGRRDLGGNWNSPVRTSALQLAILLDLDPNHPDVPKLVNELIKTSSFDQYYTTQENAYTLLAIGKYLKYFKANATNDATVAVEQGSEQIATLNLGQENKGHWIFAKDQDIPLTLKTQGQGQVFYSWRSSGIPTKWEAQSTTPNTSLSIAYRLIQSNGDEIKAHKIRHGDLVWLECTIQAKGNYENLGILQLLPTGLEAENFRLANTQAMPTYIQTHQNLKPDYVDIRTDRVHTFFKTPLAQSYVVYQGLRAIVPGQFTFPGPQLFCMYDPTIFLQTEPMELKIEIE